jgi:NADPH:quinone reductase-like Zn-dependent oxidoreductase
MKAIVVSRYGSPEVLRPQELPKPTPKDDEVLVKIRASVVNDWDWCIVRGRPYVFRLFLGLTKPRIHVPGAEIAGVVEAVGRGATRFRPGDQVYGDVSEAGFGGFAEYACVRESALIHKPSAMSFEEAAALPHAAMLALQGLVDVGRIQRGESVLINGAGGGVGVIALQIAKQFGAEVTGVDREFKLEALKSVGFDHVVDYRKEDFTRSGRSYDLILDTKTDRSVFRYLRALTPRGRYVTVGGKLLRLLQLFSMGPLIERMTGKQALIVGLKTNKDLAYVNELYEMQGLHCVIDGPHPFHNVPEAIQRFGEAKHIGKIVITTPGD